MYASYANTDKRNTIHISIQTQSLKLKEGSVPRSTKMCLREVQNKETKIARQMFKRHTAV